MPEIEVSRLKRSSDHSMYDLKKIRILLMSDVLRFCTCEKILKPIQSSNKGGDSLNDLRTIVRSLKYGKDTVYAAIVLSLFNDSKGLMVLKNYQKYWSTSSEIERLHVRAALILLNEFVNKKFSFANVSISPELYKEVKG